MAFLLRSIRYMRLVAPVFEPADRFAGVRLKQSKCEVVMGGRARGADAQAALAAELCMISEECGAVRITDRGRYLAFFHRAPAIAAGART